MEKESAFQRKLIKDIERMFDGCIIMKMDAQAKQGLPDLLILWNDRWAALECKRNARAKHQPNQDYYVWKMNAMSFSRFIFPENKEEVLKEMKEVLSA